MASIAKDLDPKLFYDAIVHFDESEEAKEFYYQVMDTPTGRKNKSGSDETVRDRILKAYGVLFCEEAGLEPGDKAGVDEVADTADPFDKQMPDDIRERDEEELAEYTSGFPLPEHDPKHSHDDGHNCCQYYIITQRQTREDLHTAVHGLAEEKRLIRTKPIDHTDRSLP